MGDAGYGGDHRLGESLPAQVVGRDRRVLDHVMQDGDDPGLRPLHAVHDPQRVEDVRQALLVHLALVGSGGDLQRLLDGRHGIPRRPVLARRIGRHVGPSPFRGTFGRQVVSP
jgi:hypothetical protein